VPITNLAIQRRRLHELDDLIHESELELFSIELQNVSIYFEKFRSDHTNFKIHGRKLTPKIIQRINEYGFKVSNVSALNEHTIIIEVYKFPTDEEKPLH